MKFPIVLIKTYRRFFFLTVLICLALSTNSQISAQEQESSEANTNTEAQEIELSLSQEIIPKDYLILPRVGNYRRGALHQDPVEAQLAHSDWKLPKKGDKVLSSVGIETQWREEGSQTGDRILCRRLRSDIIPFRVGKDHAHGECRLCRCLA